jgi:hypothetical protein
MGFKTLEIFEKETFTKETINILNLTMSDNPALCL